MNEFNVELSSGKIVTVKGENILTSGDGLTITVGSNTVFAAAPGTWKRAWKVDAVGT